MGRFYSISLSKNWSLVRGQQQVYPATIFQHCTIKWMQLTRKSSNSTVKRNWITRDLRTKENSATELCWTCSGDINTCRKRNWSGTLQKEILVQIQVIFQWQKINYSYNKQIRYIKRWQGLATQNHQINWNHRAPIEYQHA